MFARALRQFGQYYQSRPAASVARRRALGRRLSVEQMEARRLLDAKALPDLDYSISKFESDEQFKQYLLDTAWNSYGHLFGQTTNWFPIEILPVGGPMMDFLAAAELVDTGTTSSSTNVQVQGVDEDDLVETNGRELFIISHDQLSIIDVGDPRDLELISEVRFEQPPTGMFLNDQRLTVISGSPDYWNPDVTTQVTVLDVADPSNPTVLQRIELDGSFIAARRMEDLVFLVNRNDIAPPEPYYECTSPDGPVLIDDPRAGANDAVFIEPAFVGDGLIWWPTDITCTYETWEEYLSRYEDTIVDLTLPDLAIYSESGELVEEGPITSAGDIYRPNHEGPSFLASIVTIDVGSIEPEVVASAGVPTGYDATVYVSLESMYLLTQQWTNDLTYTRISKVELDRVNGTVELVANGAVAGYVLDQFSVDEYNGHLRVATSQAVWNEGSNVYVLHQAEELLELTGYIEGIAPGEQLYTARFMGDEGYLVTFLRIDPLFTLDLSDPANPHITGELEIPGFSEYLHPVGEDHLIGIGRTAAPLPSREQISLFDVSDPSGAELVSRYTMTQDGWSAANQDHHAVLYDPEYDLLAIPFSQTGWWGSQQPGFVSELLMFTVDVETGLELIGRVEHDSAVFRSVRIGSTLISIAQDSVIAVDIGNPREPLDELYYPTLSVVADPVVNIGIWEGNPWFTGAGPLPTNWQQQHSDLQAIEVVFNQSVSVRLADIELVNLGVNADQDPDQVIPLTSANLQTYGNVLRLNFTEGELPDGVYQLTVHPTASSIHGTLLDGDGDGVTGDAFVLTGSMENGFFKLTGDWNGDGAVTIFDFPVLSYWFGRQTVNHGGDAPQYVDLNGDGGVSIFDFGSFVQNFGTQITMPQSVPTAVGAGVVDLHSEPDSDTEPLVVQQRQPRVEPLQNGQRIRSVPTLPGDRTSARAEDAVDQALLELALEPLSLRFEL